MQRKFFCTSLFYTTQSNNFSGNPNVKKSNPSIHFAPQSCAKHSGRTGGFIAVRFSPSTRSGRTDQVTTQKQKKFDIHIPLNLSH